MSNSIDSVLFDSYYNTSSSSAFSSAERIFSFLKNKGMNVKKSVIDNWLQKQTTYTLHRDRRNKFNRRRYNITNIDDLWEIDLIDVQHISRQNGGNKFILAIIDCFSKFAWCVPIKRKTPGEVIRAFNTVFSLSNRQPITVQSDKGREFNNKMIRHYLKEKNIIYNTTRDPIIKAAICERFIRTIKSIIFKYFSFSKSNRYLDALESILYIYNNRKHSSIGMAPIEVNENNVLKVWTFMNNKKKMHTLNKTKYNIGDFVRVSNPKKVFDKGYKPKWTEEIFVIEKCIMSLPSMYKLRDSNNNQIIGNFYEHEIQKVKH